MIYSVRANQPGFHAVQFTAGANMIVADRSASAGDKDTTNALGKSTLIDIIDFCLGSSPRPNRGLRIDTLQDWAFTLELSIGERRVLVTRAVASPQFVAIEGSTAGWPVAPEPNGDGVIGFHVNEWRAVLAWAMFNIRGRTFDGKYAVSPRSLLSYFVRNKPAAYNSPFKYFDNQKTWDIQLHNAFLLGLNWEKASQWQVLKDQKNALAALKEAIKTGAIDGELSSLGELEAERVRLQNKLLREREAMSTFRVLPQYREIETEANRLTAEIHRLVNANITEKRRIEKYDEALHSEAIPATDRLEALYSEARVSLPDAVTKTLADAREFNRQIVENRRQFIADEVAELRARIEAREAEKVELTERRASYLQTLAGHGALEEFTRLQDLLADSRLALDSTILRIDQLRQMMSRADEIKVETVGLKRSTELDYEERRDVWTRALTLFAEYSESLYNTPGRLVIDIDDTGYRYDVEIEGSPSEGISKMKIFCYDLMLVSFSRLRGLGIDFLVHDSTIFDGVDSRQRAHAIELASARAEEFGFQYICALNSDMVPTADFTPDFDFEKLVRLRLTDTDPSGSLLGFRY